MVFVLKKSAFCSSCMINSRATAIATATATATATAIATNSLILGIQEPTDESKTICEDTFRQFLISEIKKMLLVSVSVSSH